ncbi:MAG: GAF domain-containing protein, partial [Anaerolineae bacterium]
MTYQISDPVVILRLRQILNGLQAEIDERERARAALARKNAELNDALQRRLAESESFNRLLVSLLQKTVLEQVLDIVCAEAQGLVGATGSAVLLLTDQAWLEVKHRLGKPLAAAEPVPVDGSVAGQVVRQGAPVRLNDPASFAQVQVYQWPSDLTALLAVPLHVNGAVIGVLDVVNKVGGFTEDDVPIMSVFANQAAMAIEHARLQE